MFHISVSLDLHDSRFGICLYSDGAVGSATLTAPLGAPPCWRLAQRRRRLLV